MKMKIRKCFLILSALMVVFTSMAQPVTVKASGWFSIDLDTQEDIDNFKEEYGGVLTDGSGQWAGALASSMNGGKWWQGYLLGGILQNDIEYYNKPSHVFDYVNGVYHDSPYNADTTQAGNKYTYSGYSDDDTYDYSTTDRYNVFTDNSNYDNQYYNYEWYNPLTNTYNDCDSFYYSSDYHTYYYEYSDDTYNYNNYIIDNGTHITYYIVQEEPDTSVEYEFVYDFYFELPDGRNSYDLTRDDVWGEYFVYNIVPYDSVAEDDGKTLGLWHFDGDTNDSSYWNNSAGIGSNIDYTESKFDKGKYFAGTSSSDLTLYLDKCGFTSSEPYTLEWIEYHGGSYGNLGYDNLGAYILPSYQMYVFTDNVGTYVHFALTFDGSSYSLYVNGVKVSLYNYYNRYSSNANGAYYDYKNVSSVCGFDITNNSIKVISSPIEWADYTMNSNYNSYLHGYSHYNSLIDEMRLSKGVLYTSNYVPSAEPFTTNTVLVIPENVDKGDIVIHSNYEVSDFRIGGAKPTFPIDNYVYVALNDNDVVTSVQQYQVNKWVEVDGRVYLGNDTTEDLVGYNMATFKVEEPDTSGDSSNDDGSSDSDSGSDSEDGGFDFSELGKGIADLVNAIADVIGSALSSVGDLLTSVLDSLSVFTNFSSGFSNFLGQAFAFIPKEMWDIFGAGLSLLILVGIIKIIRG